MKKWLALTIVMTMLLTACSAKGCEILPPDDSSVLSAEGTGTSTTVHAGSASEQHGTSLTETSDTETGSKPSSAGKVTDVSETVPKSERVTTTTAKQAAGGNTTAIQATAAQATTTQATAAQTTAPNREEYDIALYQNILNTENAWLASMQLSNGALPMTTAQNGTLKVCPYFSDFAALSLLNQANLYANTVKQYLNWHFSHLNTASTDYNGVDGTIYDYNIHVSNGQVTGESTIQENGHATYDSTDSYAATFLMVLQKYAEKTGDTAYIIAHKAEIERVVSALFATMSNGLTLAKPDYRVKYLMDNCEVYEGMLAGATLYTNVLVPADASTAATRDRLQNGAALVAQRIAGKMWFLTYYRPALNENNLSAWNFSWSEYYPSATSQLFPIIHGLLAPNSSRAQNLYNRFCSEYAWEEFNIPDAFYWGSNVYAAAIMGDTTRVNAYMTRYETIMQRHAYPLYNADAAKVCMAAYLMLQNAS